MKLVVILIALAISSCHTPKSPVEQCTQDHCDILPPSETKNDCLVHCFNIYQGE